MFFKLQVHLVDQKDLKGTSVGWLDVFEMLFLWLFLVGPQRAQLSVNLCQARVCQTHDLRRQRQDDHEQIHGEENDFEVVAAKGHDEEKVFQQEDAKDYNARYRKDVIQRFQFFGQNVRRMFPDAVLRRIQIPKVMGRTVCVHCMA